MVGISRSKVKLQVSLIADYLRRDGVELIVGQIPINRQRIILGVHDRVRSGAEQIRGDLIVGEGSAITAGVNGVRIVKLNRERIAACRRRVADSTRESRLT